MTNTQTATPDEMIAQIENWRDRWDTAEGVAAQEDLVYEGFTLARATRDMMRKRDGGFPIALRDAYEQLDSRLIGEDL